MKQNNSQVFSYSHLVVALSGTTKVPCIIPAAAIKKRANMSTCHPIESRIESGSGRLADFRVDETLAANGSQPRSTPSCFCTPWKQNAPSPFLQIAGFPICRFRLRSQTLRVGFE